MSDVKIDLVLTFVDGPAGLGTTLFFFRDDRNRLGVECCPEKLSPPLDNTSSRRSAKEIQLIVD